MLNIRAELICDFVAKPVWNKKPRFELFQMQFQNSRFQPESTCYHLPDSNTEIHGLLAIYSSFQHLMHMVEI